MSSSSSKESLIQKALDEFPSALKSSLPLDHFSQFYDGPYFDKLAKQISKQVLMNVQASELDVEETLAIANELLPKFQEMIREWKAKSEENKTQCDHFLQNQIDFLLNDFRTSVVIKLVSAPDVRLQDLETSLEGRKIVLIEIFEKLSKPGNPQSSVGMKTRLDEGLKGVMIEALEKQRLHLEQIITNKAEKVLEDTKRMIIEISRQLKSQLTAYQGKHPKDLVKGKLEEINYSLSVNCKGLLECHPNIYAAILRATAEVRNCLDEEDYKDMSAEEFAETLHEQLLYDFSGENAFERHSSEIDSRSTSLSGASACAIPGNEAESLNTRQQNERFCDIENEAHQCQRNDLQVDFVEEEGIKEENDEDEADQDTSAIAEMNSRIEDGLIQSGDDGENLEEKGDNEVAEAVAEISRSAKDNLKCGRGNPDKSRKRISMSTRISQFNNSRWRSARVHNSSSPVSAKRSRIERRRVVVETRKPMDDDGCSESISDDCKDLGPQKRSVCSGKPNGSKTRQAGKRRLKLDGNDKPMTDKITYLHLDKRGRPLYRCNVCNRKCYQYMLKYHGEQCGRSDDPFACKECGRTFLGKSNLDSHARTHTGETPYKCSKCPEKFGQKSSLRRHLRSHIHGTRFYCKMCRLRFISRLRSHDHNMTVHRDKLPFGCKHCEERCRSITHLKNHVITHTDLRPFRCPICNATAINKYVLASHIQTVHSQSKNAALKQANDAAVAYLVNETKDESYRDISVNKINSMILDHIIKKAKLELPKRAPCKSAGQTSHS